MEGIKNRIKSSSAVLPPALIKRLFRHFFCAAAGFLLSSVSFAGNLSPFGISLAGGAKDEYIISSAIGTAAGYLIFHEPLDALKFISAVSLICFIKIGTLKSLKQEARLYFYTGISFASALLCFIIIAFAGEITFSGMLISVCEAMIASAGACFVYRVFSLASQGGKIVCASPPDTVSFMLFGAALLVAINNFPVFGFSAAHMLAGIFIMLFARSGSESAGLMAGVCCGVTLGFGENEPHLILALPLAGLLCGISRDYGKIAVALCFVLSDSAALILMGNSEFALFSAAETAAAALVFVFLPPRVADFFFSRLFSFSADSGAGDARELLRFRIKRASKAIKDISASVKAVSQLLEKTDMPQPDGIPLSVREELCSGCPKEELCWSRNAKISKQAFETTNEQLIKNGKLSADMLPQRIKIICRSQERLIDSFNTNFCEYNALLTARQEIGEAKQLAAGQFMSVSLLLDDAAENIINIEQCDSSTAGIARGIFEELGFQTQSVVAFSPASGKSNIEAFCSVVPKLPDYNMLLEKLYEKTGRLYLQPVADEYSNYGTVLSLIEAGRLYPDIYICSHTGDGERFSGDTCESFPDGNGNFFVVLSDGMGTGSRAALDSVMTCSIMSRLMRAGFSMECAFSAVNAALMVKSAEETIATLDLLKINLSTGQTDFYKAGASFSVLRKAEKTLIVERSSLPLGILSETRFEHSDTQLSAGDSVLIMSDGVAGLPLQFFKELMRKMKNESARKIAEAIVSEAMKSSPSGRNDDITVACIKL